MKNLIWLICLLPFASVAQPFHITLWGGFAGYQGDLQNKRFAIGQSDYGGGIGVTYDISSRLAIRSNFSLGRVSAEDKNNEPSLQPRNLSFQSKITEGNLLLEWTFFDLDRQRLSPYIFAGIARYHFDPYAFDTLGNKIFLKPLSTEGQGLPQYPNIKPYKLGQWAIPFGGGIRLRVSDNVTLGYELGMRKLFTDYLDDVSGLYVDQFILAQEKGLKAVEMAFRAGEIKNSNATYPTAGDKRGGSQFKDWYYFHGLTVSFALNSSGSGFGKKGSMACPRRIF